MRPSPPTRRAALAALPLLGVAPTLLASAARAQTPPAAWRAYAERLRRAAADPAVRFDPGLERALLPATNAFRRDAGASPLAVERELERTARAQAADLLLRDYFDHRSPEGFAPSSRVALMARSLVGTTGENIAAGHGPPEPNGVSLSRFWWESEGHRVNMLRPGHTHVGHGVARRGGRFAAVALFMEVSARFPAPLPDAIDAAALLPALAAATPSLARASLEPAEADGAHAHTPPPFEGEPPRGFWRLRPLVPAAPGQGWSITFGPVVELR